ncbi:MAG TPA: GSCFA domain-containing protein [Caulobacteraceae bacterium]
MTRLDADLDATAAFVRGIELMNQKRRQEGLDLLREVIDGRRGPPNDEVLLRSYQRVMRTMADLSQWPELLAMAEAASARFPEDADARRRLGEALYFLGRPKEAETALQAAVAIDPDFAEARSALALLLEVRDTAPTKRALRPWPSRRAHFDEPRRLIAKYLLRGRPVDRFIQPSSAFFALGSCFAGNLASRLHDLGYPVRYEDIGEEVNSTFANRSLLDWIEHGAVDEPTSVMDTLYGPRVRARFQEGLERCQVFVMTLGVAACFFREDTGAFAFAPLNTRLGSEALFQHRRMRTTTVAENTRNIAAIVAAVRRLAKQPPRIVLTVSPVPLSGTTERPSAITADALSKSTLLLACDEAINADAGQGMVYWPSFEMVRWLGAHYGPDHPAYAGDDDNTRHVSEWLVNMIIDLFLQEHSVR